MALRSEIASYLENECVWKCQEWTSYEVVKDWGEEDVEETGDENQAG